MPEKFNPFDPEYKKVADLPKEEQKNFKDVEGGFVKNTAFENIDEARADEEFLMKMPDGEEVDNDLIKKYEELIGHDETLKIRSMADKLHEPIKKMIEPVLENIKNGDYQLLICDDASGRIPALVVRKLINESYRRNLNKNIDTRFIAGASMHEYGTTYTGEMQNNKKEKIRSYIEKLKKIVLISQEHLLLLNL